MLRYVLILMFLFIHVLRADVSMGCPFDVSYQQKEDRKMANAYGLWATDWKLSRTYKGRCEGFDSLVLIEEYVRETSDKEEFWRFTSPRTGIAYIIIYNKEGFMTAESVGAAYDGPRKYIVKYKPVVKEVFDYTAENK